MAVSWTCEARETQVQHRDLDRTVQLVALGPHAARHLVCMSRQIGFPFRKLCVLTPSSYLIKTRSQSHTYIHTYVHTCTYRFYTGCKYGKYSNLIRWRPGGGKIFDFSMSSTPALGPIQPPIQWVQRALSPGVKRTWREADDSPPTSAEVKKSWIYTFTPPYAFMA
jgi:hypothetical protein